MKKEHIIIGSVAVGLGAIIYFLSKSNSNQPSQNHKDYNSAVNNYSVNPKDTYGKDLAAFANDRILVSKIAQDLHDAMKDNGTDFSKIKETLSYLDEPRFEIVYKRFGMRPYGFYGQPMWGSGTKKNLREWFEKELSSSEYQELKDKFPRLL
ncbi:hypothetical protein [Capnocytophaga felis]|uniref:Uncharacterized protein n=1 Tax=Capnocytophaga felis TaxID=2267611 RepID=A0A5M4BCV8_9FLAO|nr:hypothetical protein [Capnocytophaga felis]GET46906.1 hypothetical protein RCZ01_22080 [Capnocytophaga felis]GET49427.1 hypothetical protein RCZ02_22580 [Capnocytophaga felis]